MINLTKAKMHLTGQGADSVAVSQTVRALQSANLLPAHNDVALTARELTSLLIGVTAPVPDKAAEHVIAYASLPGDFSTFGASVKSTLETEPAHISVVALRICQTLPVARVEFADGETHEFLPSTFQGRGFRQEIVISGALLVTLAMGLHFEIKSGWENDPA